jgi:putative transposase
MTRCLKLTRFGGQFRARAGQACIGRHEEFRSPINTQTVLPSAETPGMLFWAPLASGQITMRNVNGWHTLAEPLAAIVPLDLAA